jgi:hypothetical protein
MSTPSRLPRRIMDFSTRGPNFHAGVRRNYLDQNGGIRTVKDISTPAKIIGDAVYDVTGHGGGVDAAVARCVSTGSFILGGESGLAWLGSTAAPICCLLDRAPRSRVARSSSVLTTRLPFTTCAPSQTQHSAKPSEFEVRIACALLARRHTCMWQTVHLPTLDRTTTDALDRRAPRRCDRQS